jgi:hypothetical protein
VTDVDKYQITLLYQYQWCGTSLLHTAEKYEAPTPMVDLHQMPKPAFG